MPKKIDLTNQVIGEWTILREATKEEKQNRPGAYWICRCSCGTQKVVNGQTLRNKESSSCGCQTGKIIAQKNQLRAEDLTGKIFGRLKVIERDFQKEKEKEKRGSTYWKCKCNCGNITTVLRSSLIQGTTISCGCYRKECSAKQMTLLASSNYIDETGKRYGKLTVISKSEQKNYDGGVFWLCQCDCGERKVVNGASLRNGNTTSCGCIGRSKGEYNIIKILDEQNILYIKEYPLKINSKILRYDFAIIEDNKIQYIIEFDGKQHYEASNFFGGEKQLQITQENDLIKNQWCKDNNIPLIRIPYTHLKDLCIDDLLLETSNFIYKG